MPHTRCLLTVPDAHQFDTGVGLRRKSGVIEDIVRIDNDDKGKGIHLNGKNISDTSKKIAAVILPTVSKSKEERESLYVQYLHGLDNLSAGTIWEWWKTGKKPTH